MISDRLPFSSMLVLLRLALSHGRVSRYIAYTEQGENIPTILDGVSYSAFIQLCRVILSRMVNFTVASLQSDLNWPLSDPLTVSRHLSTPHCVSPNVMLLMQNVLHHLLQDS